MPAINAEDPPEWLPLADFLCILQKYAVKGLADIRSAPYSSYRREFNYRNLKEILPEQGIKYVFLGRELGARYEDGSVYFDGRADYDRIAGHHLFHVNHDHTRQIPWLPCLKKFLWKAGH